jgi:hypothetical protein
VTAGSAEAAAGDIITAVAASARAFISEHRITGIVQ